LHPHCEKARGEFLSQYIYVGPTLPVDRIAGLLPDAIIRPPVQHGDLLRVGFSPSDRVLIVDGLFHQAGAVRHKEILSLLAAGVSVAGTSSMGALRAAELDRCGMVGLGSVYRAYRDGQIVDDDEVAIVHGEAPEYRQLSVPLVNIRFGLADLAEDGVLSAAAADELLGVARQLPYPRRSWQAMRRAAGSIAPHLVDEMEKVHEAVQADPARFDVKQADALAALHWLAEGTRPGADQLSWTTDPRWRTRHFRTWEAQFHGTVVEDIFVSFGSAMNFAQIYDADFPTRWREHVLSQIFGRGPRDAERYGLRHADLTDAQRAHWLTRSEQAELPAVEALHRVLVRSASVPPERALVGSEISADSVQAVAEALEVNRQVLEDDPDNSIGRLREEALKAHLANVWGTDVDEEALVAAARDRGFPVLEEAVRVARTFYLRHILLVAPAASDAQVPA
jgi:hypothetical protein